MTVVQSHVKAETYPAGYKYPRIISSRHDYYKCRTGPIFKRIEEELFKLEWFIKYVPVDERPKHILDNLFQEGATVIATDHTCYEAHFSPLLFLVCEMQLYWYMTQLLSDTEWFPLVFYTMLGWNRCRFRTFWIWILATRMSGEMCTSCGNGFANLMYMLFTGYKCGLKSIKGRVEGDDGLFTFYGKVPTSADFAKLGLIVKLDLCDSLSEASFCGIVADMIDLINIKDPIAALLDFGWATQQYSGANDRKLKRILRTKAFSLVFQYPGCPILDALGRYGLRITDGLKFKMPASMTPYEKEKFMLSYNKYKNHLPVRTCTFRTRFLMEKIYKVSILHQFLIENYLNSLQDIRPLDHWAILANCPRTHVDYYDRFSGPNIPYWSDVYGANYRLTTYKSSVDLFHARS